MVYNLLQKQRKLTHYNHIQMLMMSFWMMRAMTVDAEKSDPPVDLADKEQRKAFTIKWMRADENMSKMHTLHKQFHAYTQTTEGTSEPIKADAELTQTCISAEGDIKKQLEDLLARVEGMSQS
jgi:hypothetical protein